MTSSQTSIVALLLVGATAVVASCADGSAADYGDVAPAADPTTTVEPTEPTTPAPTDHVDRTPSDDPDASTVTPSGEGDVSPTDESSPAAGNCATVAPSNVCGLAPQCGCASNETCDLVDGSTGAVQCVKAGPGKLGAVCSASADCGLGLTCAYGACRPFCATAKAACSGNGVGACVQGYDSGGTPIPNAQVCTVTCDPRNPSAACGTNTCVYDADAKTTDCDRPGTREVGDACANYNDCRPGLACAPHLFAMTCQSWCRIGHDEDCTLPQRCTPPTGDAPLTLGGDTFGLCQ